MEVVKYLVANGVDAKAKDDNGGTALSVAREKHAEKVIAFLENN